MRMIVQLCFIHLSSHKLAPLVLPHVNETSTDKLWTNLCVNHQACNKLQPVGSCHCLSFQEERAGPSRAASPSVDHLWRENSKSCIDVR